MGVILRFWDSKKTPVLTLAEALEVAAERNCSEVRCNLLAIVANTEGPTRKKGKAGYKRDVTLIDTSAEGESVTGAINYWANPTDVECDWLAPSLKGGDLVCLLGIYLEVKRFASGPFGKVIYPGCDRRRPAIIWSAEKTLSGEPLAMKIPAVTISGDHKECASFTKLLAKDDKFVKDVHEKVEKIVERNKAKIEEHRKKFVVGFVDEVYSINKKPLLIQMRTKDLKTNQMRRMEAASAPERFREQDNYCEMIQNWFKSQKKRFEIALLEKPLKEESVLLGAECVYVRLSEVARDAFPAVEGKLKPGAWLVLNRDVLQTIEGGNMFEYDMRWEQSIGANYPTPVGAIGMLKSCSIKI